MSYGQGEYGQQGYGGSSYESGGPQLVSSDPPDSGTGVNVDTPIEMVLASPASLDLNTLNVDIDGAQAIVGGVFQAGYTGTIDQDPETEMVVTILTHPQFPVSDVTVDITITDLAGLLATPSFTFTAGQLEETVTLAETAAVTVGHAVPVADSVALAEAFSEGPVVSESLAVSDAVVSYEGQGVGAPDTLSLSEAIELGQGLIVGVTDSLVLADFAYTREAVEVADSLAISDAINIGTGIDVPETLTLSDSLETLQALQATVLDYASAFETVTLSVGIIVGVADSLTLTDGLEESVAYADDPLTVTDGVEVLAGRQVGVTDSLALTESVGFGREHTVAESLTVSGAVDADMGLSVSETLSASDAVGTEQAHARGASETVSLSEVLATSAGHKATAAETVSITENALSIDIGANVSESLSLSEGVVPEQAAGVTVNETMSVTEGALDIDRGTTVLDYLTSSDGVAVEQATPVQDSVSVSDAAEAVQGYEVGVSDSLPTLDSISTVVGQVLPVSDLMGTVDAVDVNVEITLPDSLSTSDAVGPSAGNAQPVADVVVAGDAAQTQSDASTTVADSTTLAEGLDVGVSVILSESLAVSDDVGAQQGYQVPTGDALAVADVVGTEQEYQVPVADSTATSDSFGLGVSIDVTESLGAFDNVTESRLDRTVEAAESASAVDALDEQVGQGVVVSEIASVGDLASLGEGQVVGEALTVADTVATSIPETVNVGDTLTVSDVTSQGYDVGIEVAEALALTDATAPSRNEDFGVAETLAIQEQLSTGSFQLITGGDGRLLEVYFTQEIRVDGVSNLSNYTLEPTLESDGVPVAIRSAEPIYETFQTGSSAFLAPNNPTDLFTRRVSINGVLKSVEHVGTYFRILTGQNVGIYRIVSIEQEIPGIAIVDRDLQTVDNLSLVWHHTSAVRGVRFRTTKFTNLQPYHFEARNLKSWVAGTSVTESGNFLAQNIPAPRLLEVEPQDDGSLIVTYDETMRMDESVGNPADYLVSGPTAVVVDVKVLNDRQVRLELRGLSAGLYTLTISTSTPKDIAGNPLDPVYNQAAFTGGTPLQVRSVFTDKGPITKPPETLASGTGAVLDDFNAVTLTGASLTSDVVGRRLTLSGTGSHADEYLIKSLVSPTQVRVKGCFTLPHSDTYDWEVFDPRDGQIADDPSDVEVRINGTPTMVEAVVGLLGQVVLQQTPGEDDNVQIDYHCICNPTVEVRRLNSREFRLNSWNRDNGYPRDRQHHYRFNNVLIRPSDYEATDLRAKLDQPLERELHYRAYERAYTALLNDPQRLVLNSPNHRIAYPPAQRLLEESLVNYEGTVLPENGPTPWVRKGVGSASVLAGTLTVQDDSDGEFPTGQPVFWTRSIDVTFTHTYSQAWRSQIDVVDEFEGVFTGVAVGYSDERVAVVVGFLEEGGVQKVGLLQRGALDPGDPLSWSGGLNPDLTATGDAAELDWSALHSYRLYRDPNGTVSLYVDGDVVPILQLATSSLPYLQSVPSPFDEIQGAFFGSLSRPARSTSSWDFVRVLIQPSNPTQSGPVAITQYEANVLPENDVRPWTPVGYHGTGTILSTDFLLLDATSATDVATAAEAGLMGGDFRGYFRLEPLLSAASEYVVDAAPAVLNLTHGFDANAVMFAVDDGRRLLQLSFLADKEAPRLSYGGRSLPEDFSPYAWTPMGGQAGEMVGRSLRVTDTVVGDGLIYVIEDSEPSGSDNRVVATALDSVLEARLKVTSYVVDGSGFAGAFATVDDGLRTVGFQLQEVAGVKQVALHSDGIVVAAFDFDWGSSFHTYRVRKNTSGNLVTLFVDGVLLGTAAYSSFTAGAPELVGRISFGSSTPSSAGSTGIVDWAYCNAFRVHVGVGPRRYVGVWKGSDPDSLLGYHLPLKTKGKGARTYNTVYLIDDNANFLSTTVAGDQLVIDVGLNRGVYTVHSVISNTELRIVETWPATPTEVDYRIAKETDWTVQHRYRLVRDTSGEISVLLDANPTPLIYLAYEEQPLSSAGLVNELAGGLPTVVFGAFSSEHLSQSRWDYVRYQITRSPTEMRIVPSNQVLNQWNVMHSPERLFTAEPHDLTDFKSSSTGIVPKKNPDFLAEDHLVAFTKLNEGTPLVPLTQTWEVRKPFITTEPISGLNRPEDVLNSDGDFVLNDGALRARMVVPDDVLYSSLDIIEQTTGEISLVKPFDDQCQPSFDGVQYQKQVCLTYDGSVLPEIDPAAATPWDLVSDDPGQVAVSAFNGILTYGTGTGGTRTVYRNNSPLPDHPSLQSEATFRLRLANDGSLGTDDSQVRFGLSAPGMTAALAFVTNPSTAERFLLVLDLNNGAVLGSQSFDFLDGAYHTYRLVRDPAAGEFRVFIDS